MDAHQNFDQNLAKLVVAKQLMMQASKNIDLAELALARQFLVMACRNLIGHVLGSVVMINVRGWEEIAWLSRLARSLELANARVAVDDPPLESETLPRRFLDLVVEIELPSLEDESPAGETSEVRSAGVELAERVIREARTFPVDA